MPSPVKMEGYLAIFDSYTSMTPQSVMCSRYLFIWLVLLLICGCRTQDFNSARTEAPITTTAVQTHASQTRTGIISPITFIEFITEIETLVPTDGTEIIISKRLSEDTVTPSVPMDTVPTTLIGETIFTEIDNISSTDLVTRLRRLCCPEGYLEIEGNCFRFEDDETAFEEALNSCNIFGEESLAKIDPIKPTTQYLLDLTRYKSDSELIWIGLRRFGDQLNDTFTWTFDETILNISNWADGQPTTNTSANCAAITSNGTWVLQSCHGIYLPYICQSPQVFCAELTTAPEVTTDDFTTAEVTEIITNATTTTAITTIRTTGVTTNRSTTSPTEATTKLLTSLMTTKLTRKPTTVTVNESDEVTTEMMTDEKTTKKPTTSTRLPSTMKTTLLPSTTNRITSTTKMTTNRVISTTKLTRKSTTGVTMDEDAEVTTEMRTEDEITEDGNVTIAKPEESTNRPTPSVSKQTTTTEQPGSRLSLINKILIAIIVIFFILAIIIGCMVIYLIYKRKKGQKAVYNVKDAEMELDDIKSVEDLSKPSTSGVANTSFINDDMPEFSGAHFNGLFGKSFSLDITSHSEA